VLVKSWLLALPHLILLGVVAGAWQFETRTASSSPSVV
jgi:hypothetical protein